MFRGHFQPRSSVHPSRTRRQGASASSERTAFALQSIDLFDVLASEFQSDTGPPYWHPLRRRLRASRGAAYSLDVAFRVEPDTAVRLHQGFGFGRIPAVPPKSSRLIPIKARAAAIKRPVSLILDPMFGSHCRVRMMRCFVSRTSRDIQWSAALSINRRLASGQRLVPVSRISRLFVEMLARAGSRELPPTADRHQAKSKAECDSGNRRRG